MASAIERSNWLPGSPLPDKKPESFQDFLNDTSWKDYSEHFNTAQEILRAEIARNRKDEEDFRTRLKERIRAEYRENLVTILPEQIAKARNALLAGDVCAIDGTLAKVELMSGVRSQIGIVAVNYHNEKASYVTYVTEGRYTQYNSAEDVMEILKARKKDKRVVSDLVLRATMAYWEREHAMHQAASWKLIHGELFPFELRSGLGELKALPSSLALFRRLAASPRIGSVVSDASGIARFLGYALEPYQYLKIERLSTEYDRWLKDEAHFSSDDEKLFRSFVEDTAINYWKAVYRVGPRPYVFYAHKNAIDEFARLIMADAEIIRERGFPLLIDYADTICANLFRASDFEKRIEHELSLQGEVLTEFSERKFRRR